MGRGVGKIRGVFSVCGAVELYCAMPPRLILRFSKKRTSVAK